MSDNDGDGDWCLIESNPCIFYDMLQKMGTKNINVEDVYGLEYFDDYINHKEEVNIKHILGIEDYKGENEKEADRKKQINEIEKQKNGKIENIEGEITKDETSGATTTNTTINTTNTTNTNDINKEKETLYNSDIHIETKYNKLLTNNSHVYGIIFLFNIDKTYNSNKYVEHNVPENLFFAKQVIPNACATQAILSIVLNKEMDLEDEIKNIKTFSQNFDCTMKGLTLSSCAFLRDLHNSYKAPLYVDKEEIVIKRSEDNFHFVSYISFEDSVYLLDGLQNGPVLITSENDKIQNDWIAIAKENIEKEINKISNAKDGKDIRFNIITVVKDKEHLLTHFINIHRVIRQRANIKLIGLGENLELEDEIDEEDYDELLNLYNEDNLPSDITELKRIVQKATLEINYLETLLTEQKEIKKMWAKELTFKFFNFSPFILTSLDLMAKHKMLKLNFQNAKEKCLEKQQTRKQSKQAK